MTPTPSLVSSGPGAGSDRRNNGRRAAGFYLVENRGPGRYFRLVRNVSENGLMFENPIADERPGETLELELPLGGLRPARVRAQVVHVTDNQVGVRLLDPVDGLERAGDGGGPALRL